MKQRMELKDVWNYYKTSSIIQTHEGFEFPDELRGFTPVILSHDFYRFYDGGLIDPKVMLVDRMGWMRREMLVNLRICFPVSMSYIFGRFAVVDGEKKFYIQDPIQSTSDSMDIWVEAEWDLRQGVSNEGWVLEVERSWHGEICYQKTISEDEYETRGKQIWILHATTAMIEVMKLKLDFYTWQRQMIERSDKILQKFEAEKEMYQERIVACLKELPGRIHWLVAAEEEELWPKYDANRELWERNECDWQIIQFDECLEIRWRGGSPGVFKVERPRYDVMGLQICRGLKEE